MTNEMGTKKQIFNLPITYLVNKQQIQEHIKTDLELVGEKSLYDTVFQPTTIYGKQTIHLWSNYYTSDKNFIKDSQQLIKTLGDHKSIDVNETDVNLIWQEICTETGFVEKYNYVEWTRFKEFNNSSSFLQLLSLYNMTSPLLSLAVPIFFLIVPFILLKIQGIPISLNKYFEILKLLFKQHQLGQIFTIGAVSWDKIIYIIASFGFYILQVYQNVISCIKYYQNMKKIHSQLFTMREYAKQIIEKMNVVYCLCETLPTYQPFIADMQIHKTVFTNLFDEFNKIIPNGFSFKKIKQIGHVMKCFYQLYNKQEYKDAFIYSFGLNGYIDNLYSLTKRYENKQVNICKIINQNKILNKNTKFTDAYFPTLLNTDSEPVKNSYTLNKHLLITGPNAAGKTTLLKTTIFNVLFSQQTGFGFYKKSNLILYDKIHCYINIPDTSGRDSLFQAEARRCKDILTSIVNSDNTQQHLCVFDELYSGTNHYEAISSAYAFLSYLNKYNNVNFVLTTHYLELCKRLDNQNYISNCHMEVKEDGDNFKYTYKLKKNVSTVKGGLKVLRDLDYPKEIIDNAIATLKNTFL